MPPLSLLIKPVSGACNMRCGYCFYADEMGQRAQGGYGVMSRETARTVIRRAFAFAGQGVDFAFQGGEPTLAGAGFYREWLRQVNLVNNRGLRVGYSLQTNGLHLEEDLLDVLAEGQFLVGVSLDGTQAIHDSRRKDAQGWGTYERIMSNIKRLKARGIPYNILCVVDGEAASRGRQIYEALKPHGYLQFIPCLDPLGENGQQALGAPAYGQFLTDLLDGYEKSLRSGRYVSVSVFDNWIGLIRGQGMLSCGMRGHCSPNFMVESNGNVYPCDFYGLDEWLLGNLMEDSLYRISKAERLTRFLDSGRETAPACRECKWLFICRGGCRRDRQTGIDTLPGINRLCQGYRMFFDACFDRLAALARLEVADLPRQ